MIVLPQDQIDTMVKILDVILRNELSGKLTVEDMKAKYSLTPEEYDMIYDLAMPLIRKQNEKGMWKTRASSFKCRIYNALIGDKSETATKVRKFINEFDQGDWSWMFPGGQNLKKEEGEFYGQVLDALSSYPTETKDEPIDPYI